MAVFAPGDDFKAAIDIIVYLRWLTIIYEVESELFMKDGSMLASCLELEWGKVHHALDFPNVEQSSSIDKELSQKRVNCNISW